ncbi:MAG: FtsW/RodA/SpoVE family cell cycle protein [Saprospiraceae bacterium]|nr:FtsW/RodA/SpoVE family cell cycle protein [Saprospiraceae bacterium]
MSLINRATAELKGDRVIWAIVAVLALFSILAVYSSSSLVAFQKRSGNTEFYLIKQVAILTLGLILTYAAYLLHYKRYNLWAPYMLALVVPLLMLTLVIGREINNASRWLDVPGIGLTFQTSDLAKIALITYIARSITAKQEHIRDFQSAFVPIIVPIIIVCLLIAPSDLSTAMVIFVTCLLMMFIGRVAIQYVLLLIFCGLVSFAGLIVASKFLKEGAIRTDTWTSRMRDFIENGDGQPQTQLAKMAIAKGGLFGNGPGNSIQKNYLPMAYTDYIYAVIIEEYGLIGGFLTLSLYVLLFLRVVRLVTKSPKTFPAMLAMGLCLVLTIQALANMAVSVHLVPVTGLPMPMISMGGTSLLFSCISLGMILSVSKFIETEK